MELRLLLEVQLEELAVHLSALPQFEFLHLLIGLALSRMGLGCQRVPCSTQCREPGFETIQLNFENLD